MSGISMRLLLSYVYTNGFVIVAKFNDNTNLNIVLAYCVFIYLEVMQRVILQCRNRFCQQGMCEQKFNGQKCIKNGLIDVEQCCV